MHGEFETGVAYGHCRTWLETFSQETGIPFEVLASRVSELLQNLGERTEHHLPVLRRKTKRTDTTVAQVAVAKRTPSNRPRSKTQAGAKAYWNRMSAKERSEEMGRRIAKRRANQRQAAKAA